MTHYTTEKLYEETGCVSDDGVRMWLACAGIPYTENGQGRPQVTAMFSHMVAKAKDPIHEHLSKSYTLKRTESAVYLLKLKGCVVYVGMSNVLMSRLGKHSTGALKFDEVEVIPVAKKYVLKLESELIARHQPKHNKSKMPVPAENRLAQ